MLNQILKRRDSSIKRISNLQKKLKTAEFLLKNVACVYATGSFGRKEAGIDSDLDLFIVSTSENSAKSNKIFTRLDEICLKAKLIEATRKLKINEFDGDGKYLIHYNIDELKNQLGHPDDDALNTFTARLLLLLESSPLLGSDAYNTIVGDVIEAYCEDFPKHQDEFVPTFLINDILRLWRTLCVNYEARTTKETPEAHTKRRQKNYTLKYSRLLTCFSGVLFLLSVFRNKSTVSPDDIKDMTKLSPSERIEFIIRNSNIEKAKEPLKNILNEYDEYLTIKSDAAKFKEIFLDYKSTQFYMKKSYEFSRLFFEAIDIIGDRNRFHQILVV